MYPQQVSGRVLTEEEAGVVGSAPMRAAVAALVFQFSVDFTLAYAAGDLVVVPRSQVRHLGLVLGSLVQCRLHLSLRRW